MASRLKKKKKKKKKKENSKKFRRFSANEPGGISNKNVKELQKEKKRKQMKPPDGNSKVSSENPVKLDQT